MKAFDVNNDCIIDKEEFMKVFGGGKLLQEKSIEDKLQDFQDEDF